MLRSSPSMLCNIDMDYNINLNILSFQKEGDCKVIPNIAAQTRLLYTETSSLMLNLRTSWEKKLNTRKRRGYSICR